MTSRRRFLFALLVILSSSSSSWSESNGKLLSVEFEKTLSPSDIDTFNKELFEGNTAPQARFAVRVYWVRFESLYPDGKTAIISSQVFLPVYRDTNPRSMYVFGSGSTGLRDSCRPSREHIAGIHWGYYRSHVLAHAGQGSIGVLPDYMGFGDPDRLQYYMVALAEARVMLDAIAATKNLIRKEGISGISQTKHFVAGFSQGGHAAFAAADYRSEYAPEIELSGIIGYGPTTDIFSLFKEYSGVAPMVLYTYENLYGSENFDPAQVLLNKYADTLESDLLRMCVGGMQSFYPHQPQDLFKEEFTSALLTNRIEENYGQIYRHIQKNSTGLGEYKTPVVIYQGGNDIVIAPETQENFIKTLKNNGVSVDYVFYKNARHDTRQISFSESRTWIDNHTN